TEDFRSLTNIHALYTVYFDGGGATDEKLKALAQLRFTNLTSIVFTDCNLVTDSGLEHLSQISTLEGLGLRGMSITDAACETMATKMRLIEINMPRCPEVTAKGLLRLAHCETIESLGFSVGTMSQDDLIRLVSTAA